MQCWSLDFEFGDPAIIAVAADFFESVHNDWDDALLAAYALSDSSGRVLSFDRGIDRIPGVTRIEP